MYLDTMTAIPAVSGKITFDTKNDTTYVKYEYERVYDAAKKYTNVKRATIGKRSKQDPSLMQPNEIYLKYFPEAQLPETRRNTERSSSLKAGTYLVIRKILNEYGIPDILSNYFDEKEKGLTEDLIAYNIVTENNAGQYYPDYAYDHPLFSQGMRIYSDSTISRFLKAVTDNQISGFLKDWNKGRDKKEKIYISYDSTNKNCQAGELSMVEFGHPKDDQGEAIFNYSVAYDTKNQEALFYEEYPGSIVDIQQLTCMVDKIKDYGYENLGFILDRGYFCRDNIDYMDKNGYDFIIMVKGMTGLINDLIIKNKGTFEKQRPNNIREHKLFGKTIKKKLYETDKKNRYIHLYHNSFREANEIENIEVKIDRLKRHLDNHKGRPLSEFTEIFQHYFILYGDEENKLTFYEERPLVIEREEELCGYFAIVTSAKMTAKEAINLYKGRDASEKMFRTDKSFLGNKSIRVYSDESATAKIFIEFLALIVRNRIYTRLKDAALHSTKQYNYMTVPAAIKELEKIEMVRTANGTYRMDHAVSATQKEILKAFWIDEAYIKDRINGLSEELKIADSRKARD